MPTTTRRPGADGGRATGVRVARTSELRLSTTIRKLQQGCAAAICLMHAPPPWFTVPVAGVGAGPHVADRGL